MSVFIDFIVIKIVVENNDILMSVFLFLFQVSSVDDMLREELVSIIKRLFEFYLNIGKALKESNSFSLVLFQIFD